MKPRPSAKSAKGAVFGRRWFLAVAIRGAPRAPSKRRATSRRTEARAA
jgi:hypothetical protein